MARRIVLVRIREDRKLTQAQACKLLGLTENYLRGIETGRVPLTDSALVKIARGYKLSFDELDRQLRNGRARKSAA